MGQLVRQMTRHEIQTYKRNNHLKENVHLLCTNSSVADLTNELVIKTNETKNSNF